MSEYVITSTDTIISKRTGEPHTMKHYWQWFNGFGNSFAGLDSAKRFDSRFDAKEAMKEHGMYGRKGYKIEVVSP